MNCESFGSQVTFECAIEGVRYTSSHHHSNVLLIIGHRKTKRRGVATFWNVELLGLSYRRHLNKLVMLWWCAENCWTAATLQIPSRATYLGPLLRMVISHTRSQCGSLVECRWSLVLLSQVSSDSKLDDSPNLTQWAGTHHPTAPQSYSQYK